MKRFVGLGIVVALLLGGCAAIEGGAPPPFTSVLAVAAITGLKFLNDRFKFLAWPMEFVLASAVLMIVFNLVRLYVTPLPY